MTSINSTVIDMIDTLHFACNDHGPIHHL